MTTLNTLEIETKENPTHSVIWLHGLGADGHDFEDVVPALRLNEQAIRFIFPHAPNLAVTINGGMQMPAWYDITHINIERTVDEVQLRASAAEVVKLIERENARGIASEHIVLAGFSQGGAVVYEVFLSYPKPLAGLICLSTYLATADTLKEAQINRSQPIFIGHGSEDPIVPEFLAQKATETLTQWGYQPVFKSYKMAHSLCIEQVKDLADWFKAWL